MTLLNHGGSAIHDGAGIRRKHEVGPSHGRGLINFRAADSNELILR